MQWSMCVAVGCGSCCSHCGYVGCAYSWHVRCARAVLTVGMCALRCAALACVLCCVLTVGKCSHAARSGQGCVWLDQRDGCAFSRDEVNHRRPCRPAWAWYRGNRLIDQPRHCHSYVAAWVQGTQGKVLRVCSAGCHELSYVHTAFTARYFTP